MIEGHLHGGSFLFSREGELAGCVVRVDGPLGEGSGRCTGRTVRISCGEGPHNVGTGDQQCRAVGVEGWGKGIGPGKCKRERETLTCHVSIGGVVGCAAGRGGEGTVRGGRV